MKYLNKHNGYTILELVTAITITLAISTLIFAAYLAIFKQFKFHTRNAQSVMEATLAKKKIDRAFRDVTVVTAIYKAAIEYSKGNTTERRTLSVRDNALYNDNTIVIKGIKSLEYSVYEKKTPTGRQLILWEAFLVNGCWIGGAQEVIVK